MERLSEESTEKTRIFLGSSAQQAKVVQALTRGLKDVAHVELWTTSFNPGTTTLERLLQLTREVDFAAFVRAGRLDEQEPGCSSRAVAWSGIPAR
jgi:hypothetical protein